MTQDPFNPYQPPESAQLAAPHDPFTEDDQLPPLPWEDTDRFPGFWQRVGGMFSLAFSDPLGYFARVPRGRGYLKPWQFQLLMLSPAFVILILIFGVIGVVGFSSALGAPKEAGDPPAWIFAAILPIFLLLMPLFIFIGMMIGGAFSHLFLWMWGGLKPGESIEQSIRAYGYAQSFIALGGMIPYLGILVQLAGLVWMGLGLARMHRTDTWRGVCALLITPIIVICCCGIGAALTIPALLSMRPH
jgi:hypothetical protein